eukprot:4307978-Amphidinium_carterae.1
MFEYCKSAGCRRLVRILWCQNFGEFQQWAWRAYVTIQPYLQIEHSSLSYVMLQLVLLLLGSAPPCNDGTQKDAAT